MKKIVQVRTPTTKKLLSDIPQNGDQKVSDSYHANQLNYISPYYTGLNLLIAKLDKRLAKSSEKSDKNFKRLRRETGEPVVCSPAVGTPKWAIDVNVQMQPQSQGDDSGGSLQLGTEIEISESSDVDPSESFVESEVDSDFALELD